MHFLLIHLSSRDSQSTDSPAAKEFCLPPSSLGKQLFSCEGVTAIQLPWGDVPLAGAYIPKIALKEQIPVWIDSSGRCWACFSRQNSKSIENCNCLGIPALSGVANTGIGELSTP